MRYEYWDVILFPAESHIPIQEFRTACYVSQGQDGRRLPILTCFVRSLSPSSPFRISVHSWTKPTTSSYIESKRKPEQRVVYTTRVIVDGFRILHNYFEKNTSWPQQIRNENRRDYEGTKPTFGFLDSAIRGSSLLFPAFHPSVLSQSSWDARESNGRIKVIVAEELISESASGIVKSGATNDLICFSFQHAPKDILSQVGLSWPLPQPIHRASSISASAPSALSSRRSRAPPLGHAHSPTQKPQLPDTQTYDSPLFTHPPLAAAVDPLADPVPDIAMTLKDDLFEQLIEALGPEKGGVGLGVTNGDRNGTGNGTGNGAGKRIGIATRPSAAALARTTSYITHPFPGTRPAPGAHRPAVPFPAAADDTSMRNSSSSAFSSLSRRECSVRPRSSSAVGIRSRKEGRDMEVARAKAEFGGGGQAEAGGGFGVRQELVCQFSGEVLAAFAAVGAEGEAERERGEKRRRVVVESGEDGGGEVSPLKKMLRGGRDEGLRVVHELSD